MAHRREQIVDQDEEMTDAGSDFEQGPNDQFNTNNNTNDDVVRWNRSYLSQQWHPADDIHPPSSNRKPSSAYSEALSEATSEKLKEAEGTLRQIQRTASNAAMLSGHLNRPRDEQFYLEGVDNVTADLGEVLDVLKNRAQRARRGAISGAPPPPGFKVGRKTLSQSPRAKNAMVRKNVPSRGGVGRRTDIMSAAAGSSREGRAQRSGAPSPKGPVSKLQAAAVLEQVDEEEMNYEGLTGILDPEWENKQKLKKAIEDLSNLKVNLAHITKEYDNLEDLEMANAIWDAGVGRSREPDWDPEEQPIPPEPIYVDRRNAAREGTNVEMGSSPAAQQGGQGDAMEWRGASSSPAAARAGDEEHRRAAAAGVHLPTPLHVRFARQSITDDNHEEQQMARSQAFDQLGQLATPENPPAPPQQQQQHQNRELFPSGPRTPSHRLAREDALPNPSFTQQFHEQWEDWGEDDLFAGHEQEANQQGEVQPIPFRLNMAPREETTNADGATVYSDESEGNQPRYESHRQAWDARRAANNRERMRQLERPVRAAGTGRGGGRRAHPYGRPEFRRR